MQYITSVSGAWIAQRGCLRQGGRNMPEAAYILRSPTLLGFIKSYIKRFI